MISRQKDSTLAEGQKKACNVFVKVTDNSRRRVPKIIDYFCKQDLNSKKTGGGKQCYSQIEEKYSIDEKNAQVIVHYSNRERKQLNEKGT